ncbi:MAG: HEPN domain-containing protein [Candidatus Omnitrophica bacterium]|nr:HEPN domain-containing protein [Candidatus Omnitrophota bacterium]
MPERSADWYRQAERDLDSARSQLGAGFFEWSSFISQQAAEKAAKSVYQKLGGDAWGHSVTDLLKGLKKKLNIADELVESAKALDRFYIPARYPNGWANGTPSEYITEKDAKDAIGNSEKILRFCKDILAR